MKKNAVSEYRKVLSVTPKFISEKQLDKENKGITNQKNLFRPSWARTGIDQDKGTFKMK